MTKWRAWKTIAKILWSHMLIEERQNAWIEITQFFSAAQGTSTIKPEEVRNTFGLK